MGRGTCRSLWSQIAQSSAFELRRQKMLPLTGAFSCSTGYFAAFNFGLSERKKQDRRTHDLEKVEQTLWLMDDRCTLLNEEIK